MLLTEIDHRTQGGLEAVQLLAIGDVNSHRAEARQTERRIMRPKAADIESQAEMVAEVEFDAAAIVQGRHDAGRSQLSRVENGVQGGRLLLGFCDRFESGGPDAASKVGLYARTARPQIENRIDSAVMNLVAERIAPQAGRNGRDQAHIIDHEVIAQLNSPVAAEIEGYATSGSTAVGELFAQAGVHFPKNACAAERVEFNYVGILVRRAAGTVICITRSLRICGSAKA